MNIIIIIKGPWSLQKKRRQHLKMKESEILHMAVSGQKQNSQTWQFIPNV